MPEIKTMQPTLSAYSPQRGGDDMEGGYASARKGPDGQFLVRTLQGVYNGAYDWVTLAGHPDWYGKKFIIPKIEFINKNGKKITLTNVKAVVHDTGRAFKSKEAQRGERFDIAVAKDLPNAIINKQPWSMKNKVEFILVSSFDEKPKLEKKFDNTTDNKKSDGLPWLDTAASLIGVDETPGSRNNPTIVGWADDVGVKKTYTADSIPWCGLFVGYCMAINGIKPSSAPLWALSWNNWGEKLDYPVYGCVLVFKRNGGGHVGFAISQDRDYYHVLGGNQSDSVNVTKIAKSRCVGYRWPKGYDHLKPKQKLPTKKFTGKISTNEA